MINIIVAGGCANIIPPTGGPRDSIPPVLINASPKDSTINFKSNKIVLTFNEYIQLDNNLNEDFIVSPTTENIPLAEAKLKTVTIKLKDSLKPNTTYSLDFGNSLKDVNEGNPLKHFTYVFSTGNIIDTGTIAGNITLAETGEADSTLIVALYNNLNDSAVKKTRPDYYTRLDSGGNFRFHYLPSSRFAIYVLENDYAKRYDDSTKMFAFYNTYVQSGDSSEFVKLYAYQQEKPKENVPEIAASTNNKKGITPEDKRLKFSTNLESNQQDLLSNLEIVFNRRITRFDTGKIILSDTNFSPVTGFTIFTDTSSKKISLQFPWTENEFYKLLIKKEAFADSAGITVAKDDTISFSTKSESQYGSIHLHFTNIIPEKNPVLQMIQSDKIVKSVALSSADWDAKLFEPGEYELRILYDNNKNGIWDPGDFAKKKPPEIVKRIPRTLIIKSNWDNAVEINL